MLETRWSWLGPAVEFVSHSLSESSFTRGGELSEQQGVM